MISIESVSENTKRVIDSDMSILMSVTKAGGDAYFWRYMAFTDIVFTDSDSTQYIFDPQAEDFIVYTE